MNSGFTFVIILGSLARIYLIGLNNIVTISGHSEIHLLTTLSFKLVLSFSPDILFLGKYLAFYENKTTTLNIIAYLSGSRQL